MTHQIIIVQPAHLLRNPVYIPIADVDFAVDFASWLESQGFKVHIEEGHPLRYPNVDEAAVHALTEMYARSRA